MKKLFKKIIFFKSPLSSDGLSLIDVMIAMSIGMVVILGLSTAVYHASRSQQLDNQKISGMAARNFVYQALTSWRPYRATLNGNAAAFACALNNTGCTAAVKGNFVLYGRTSAMALEVLYDPTSVANGLDENGNTCTSATGTAPSVDCPVRIDFSWVPLCTTSCTDPVPISITATITVYDPTRKTSVNSGLDFTLLKSVHSRRCLLPWGRDNYINDGATVTAWNQAAYPCQSVTRTCTDTELDNQYDYKYQTCQCSTPWGSRVNIGSSVTAYLTENAPCTSQVRTCQADASLSGTYTYQACDNTCALPWGGSINHGDSVFAFLTSTPACVQETRTCNNGVLSGSYTNQTCTGAACTLPWGGSIVHGASVTAYLASYQNPSCTSSQLRTCSNGLLSGSYTKQTCLPCGGTVYGSASGTADYCWYKSADGGNCTSTCAVRGGCNLTAVQAYGSGGTDTRCNDLARFIDSTYLWYENIALTTGCYSTFNTYISRGTDTTTCGAVAPSTGYRYCPCNN